MVVISDGVPVIQPHILNKQLSDVLEPKEQDALRSLFHDENPFLYSTLRAVALRPKQCLAETSGFALYLLLHFQAYDLRVLNFARQIPSISIDHVIAYTSPRHILPVVTPENLDTLAELFSKDAYLHYTYDRFVSEQPVFTRSPLFQIATSPTFSPDMGYSYGLFLTYEALRRQFSINRMTCSDPFK